MPYLLTVRSLTIFKEITKYAYSVIETIVFIVKKKYDQYQIRSTSFGSLSYPQKKRIFSTVKERVSCSFVQYKIKPCLTECMDILTYRAGSLAFCLKNNHFSHVYHQIRRSVHQLDITGGARASLRSARASFRSAGANSGSTRAVVVGDVSFVSRRGLTF
jgi:hypothetical protein